MSKTEILTSLIEPAVEAVGYDLWGLEYLPSGKHSVLRVYIDEENGITIEDCEKASRQISLVMDVEDPLGQEYVLEVSSPGMDRPLFQPEHFTQYKGKSIAVKFHKPIDKRRKVIGVLQSVTEDGFELEVDGSLLTIEFSNVFKANLEPVF